MPTNEPTERSLTAQALSHESWAKTTDRTARTETARAAFRAKLLDQADGDPVRAEHMWRAHIARMQLKAMQARRRAKEQADLVATAEAELKALSSEARQ